MKDISDFIKKLDQLEIHLNGQQVDQFIKYYEMLIEKNKVMNLTAITEFEEVIDKHFIDSLTLKNAVDLQRPLNVIDVGTGAGFPGIPLKIAFPEIKMVLLDSLNKRVGFLNEVIDQLGLKGIRACHGRAEDFGRDLAYREQFDLCVSRAVANLSTLSEYCMPFVKVGGQFVSYKSVNADEEAAGAVRAVKILGGQLKQIYSFKLPKTNIDRTFIIIDKVKKTEKTYPRKAGKPSKEPLI